MNLSDVINEIVEERGLDRETICSIVAEGILAAYQKKYPEADLFVDYDSETDEAVVKAKVVVVSHVSDPHKEIGLRKAHAVSPKASVGDTVSVVFSEPIGRIEVLRAKQIIASQIRRVEAESILSEFKPKEGSIVQGTVYKVERNGIIVKIQDSLAFLPMSLSLPGAKYVVGAHIRAILKEVLLEPRNDSQLVLEQASSEFIKKLFEIEIPEVFERIVEIKRVVRVPGYKTKVVVSSSDKNIDPVGTCVGVGGVRIRPILKEVGGEKIDVLSSDGKIEDFVRESLRPADINRVLINSDGSATVWVDEEQRSLAIGKMGQNIGLASELVGIPIFLAGKSKIKKEEVFVKDAEEDDSK